MGPPFVGGGGRPHALGGCETTIARFGPGAGDLIRDASCQAPESVMG